MQVTLELQSIVLTSLLGLEEELNEWKGRESELAQVRTLISAFEQTPSVADLVAAWRVCSIY